MSLSVDISAAFVTLLIFAVMQKGVKKMSEWMIFAERLSEQIKKQNLSIRQLAKRMDMTPTTIFRYAKGQRVPRANEILKASDVLGVTCDYLVGLSDDPKKTSRPSAQPEPEWIPVTERLPKYGEPVLWCNEKGSVFTTAITFVNERGDFAVGKRHRRYSVVAWKPLPEPYKEGQG